MQKIVKYNNELNYMPMPNFKGTQQDLFFAILSFIKDKHDSTNCVQRFFDTESRRLVIPLKKFIDICRIEDAHRNFTEIWKEIKNFLDILTSYKIEYRTKFNYYIFVCFEEAEHDANEQTINITFQKKFYDMVVNHQLGYTRFELAEFISLSGKYTKTLYRLLKQYRQTGYLKMEWAKFVEIMQIPSNKIMGEIDRDILKPALRELTKPRTLFDKERIPFKNLTYTKLKGRGRGRGGNVIGIEFKFDIEDLELLESNYFFDENFRDELARAKGNYFSKNGEWLFISNAFCADSRIIFGFYNNDTKETFSRTYDKGEYEQDIKPFIIDGSMKKLF